MSDAAQTFNEAYELIEQGNLATARQLLDDIRAENENDPDFWWLYAHAVEDEEAGQEALNRVRQLRPDYLGVDSLVQKAGISPPASLQSLRPPPQSLPDLPTKDIDDEFSDFDDDEFDIDEPSSGRNRRNLMILAGIAIVAIILAALFVPSLLNDDETATPILTTIVVQPTVATPIQATAASIDSTEAVDPTDDDIEPTVMPTDEVTLTEDVADPTDDDTEPTEAVEPTDGDYADLAAQVSQFNVPDEGVDVGETLLGNTLLISTCSPPGPVATQSILGIITVLKGETIGDEIEAIGFRITNCSDDTVSRIIGVARADFDDFASDTITAQELQGLMRPIG